MPNFVVVERSCYLLNKVHSNDIKCKVFIEPTIKVFTNITCCLVVAILQKKIFVFLDNKLLFFNKQIK